MKSSLLLRSVFQEQLLVEHINSVSTHMLCSAALVPDSRAPPQQQEGRDSSSAASVLAAVPGSGRDPPLPLSSPQSVQACLQILMVRSSHARQAPALFRCKQQADMGILPLVWMACSQLERRPNTMLCISRSSV